MSTTTNPRYLILLGAPGAGKGTQAQLLTEALGIPHLASGDVFRGVRAEDSEMGALVRSFYDRGMLVPDAVAIRLILTVLAREDYAAGAMLDGFPRTLDQARSLDEELAQENRAIWNVLYIRVSADELLQRIAGRWLCRSCSAVYHERFNPPKAAGTCDACGGDLYQRVDDKPETARVRLQTFFRETEPLIGYYSAQGKLCEVNGEQSVEAVGADLRACLHNCLHEAH